MPPPAPPTGHEPASHHQDVLGFRDQYDSNTTATKVFDQFICLVSQAWPGLCRRVWGWRRPVASLASWRGWVAGLGGGSVPMSSHEQISLADEL